MITLIVLLGMFLVSFILLWVVYKRFYFMRAGRIALSAMLLFTAIGHFAFTEGIAMMLPMFVPFKKEIVILTGILEIALAVGILIAHYRSITGWSLIVFLVLALPANIYGAINAVNYQLANHDGPGPDYLWFRIPLQFLFIVWTYITCILYSKKN